MAPRIDRRTPAALIVASLAGVAATAAFAEQQHSGSLSVVELTAELGDGEGTLLLPRDTLAGFRRRLGEDEQFSCFSVNLQSGARRLWVPLRRKSDAAILIPGGDQPAFESIELRLSRELPAAVRKLRLSLGQEGSVLATAAGRDRIRIAPLEGAARLRGVAADGILKHLITDGAIEWQGVRE